jgi:hypothetical protein
MANLAAGTLSCDRQLCMAVPRLRDQRMAMALIWLVACDPHACRFQIESLVAGAPISGSAMASAVAVVALVVTSMATGNTTRPNVLFMMSDQQRHDTLGIVTPSLATPNLDREFHKAAHALHKTDA